MVRTTSFVRVEAHRQFYYSRPIGILTSLSEQNQWQVCFKILDIRPPLFSKNHIFYAVVSLELPFFTAVLPVPPVPHRSTFPQPHELNVPPTLISCVRSLLDAMYPSAASRYTYQSCHASSPHLSFPIDIAVWQMTDTHSMSDMMCSQLVVHPPSFYT